MKKNHFSMIQENFDLQMFSNTPDTTASEGLSAEMKTFYDKNLLRLATPNLVHQQFGQKRSIPKNGGKMIEFRRFSNLAKATTPLQEAVTPDGKNITVTAQTATLAQYGDYVVQSDLLRLTSIDPMITETQQVLADQAAATTDTVTRDIMNGGTSVSYSSKWSGTTETKVTSRLGLDSTAILTAKDVKRAVAKLRGQNAKTWEGYYIGIIHPYVAYDLMNDADWVTAAKYGDPEKLFSGEIGKLAGVRFVESSEAKILAAPALTAAKRNLTVASLSTKTITVDEAITSAEATALAGRKIIIDGVQGEIASAAAGSAGSATITLKEIPTGMAPADGDIVYPGEAAGDGSSVFSTLFLAKDAYGVIDLEGGNLQTIVKQLGSSGSADALDQRGSVGWKCSFTAKVLNDNYMVRQESCSGDFRYTSGN